MRLLANLFSARNAPDRGARGERAAARHLRAMGYKVLDRNWRYRQWELDLVCLDGETVVFVEVKTRRKGSMTTPAEGLTRRKREKLIKAASHYLSARDLWERPSRFDLAAVTDTGKDLVVEHIQNVFDASDFKP